MVGPQTVPEACLDIKPESPVITSEQDERCVS
jgi:hypothetical protein